ncbi:SCP-like protein, partial [Oesophagostomum dentatum]
LICAFLIDITICVYRFLFFVGKTTIQCPEDYRTINSSETNTQCPENYGMTDSLRDLFLGKHNYLRCELAIGNVSNGQTGQMCRKAAKLPAFMYCCDLEKTAYDRAKLCDQFNSTSLEYLSENSWTFVERVDRPSSEAAESAIENWWSELSKLQNGIEQIQNLYYTHAGINSFAKMASDLTTGVGCGVVRCGKSTNVVCHYQTSLTNGVRIYGMGPTCRRCQTGLDSCINNLCPAASDACPAATTETTTAATLSQ